MSARPRLHPIALRPLGLHRFERRKPLPGGTGRSIEHDQPGESVGAELVDVCERLQGPEGPAAEHEAFQIQVLDERTEVPPVPGVVVVAGRPGAPALRVRIVGDEPIVRRAREERELTLEHRA